MRDIFKKSTKGRLLAVLALAISWAAPAQDEVEGYFCHTYEMQDKLFEEQPHLKAEAEALQAEFNAMVKGLPDGEFERKDGEPYIIPVVFHVIHYNGPENISDEQIMNAVEEMTLDFNAENTDLPLVHPAFADIVGDVGVEFRLAQRDPQGNCTNGIVRTVSSTTFAGGENLKEVSPIWDRSSYLNIWVCKSIASGAAGYTYYPSSLNGSFGETNDGIVVRHDYVGGIGTSGPGRRHVLTHEVGHWINLPHVWGSSNEPGLPENCEMDDGVEDTPNTIGWTTCNIYGESCGSLDNVENFMEYAYCSKMFTEGQKTRMLAALNTNIAKRNSLWQEENLIATGVLGESLLCEAAFTANRRTVCVGQSVSFSDDSYSGVVNRNWIFDGGSPAGAVGQNPVITYNTPGEYAVALLVSDGQGNTQSSVKQAYIRVLDTAMTSLPYSEGFETVAPGMSPEGIPWFEFGLEDAPSTDTWKVTDVASFSGEHSIRIVETDMSGLPRTLSSETFDFSEFEVLPSVTFKYAAAAIIDDASASLTVWISKDCGETWNLRNEISGNALFTGGVYWDEYVPAEDDWKHAFVPLMSQNFLSSGFQLKFVFTSGNANAVYIDDILIEPTPVTDVSDWNDAKAGLRVYPNPTGGAVRVELPERVKDIGDVQVLDYTGRPANGFHNLGSDRQMLLLDLSGLAPGMYFVRVGDLVGRVMVAR